MGRIGSRITGLRPRPQALSGSFDFLGDRIRPDSRWTGVPGSGFLVTPSDQTRITAKPVCRLVTVPNRRITSSHEVGVMAFANANGGLFGGIDRVRFHFEGNTLDVVAPSLRTLTRKDGSTYLVLGYWVKLQRVPSVAGDAHLYIEAIPADATMQSRIIGPFTYTFASPPYDLDIEVAPTPAEIPGARYNSLAAAINWLKTQAPNAARIRITESGTYIPSENATNCFFPGWLTIEAIAGVEATIANENSGGLSLRSGNIAFRNMTIDMRRISMIESIIGTPFWADRCMFINSDPQGAVARWFGQTRPINRIFSTSSYFTDCDFQYVPDVFGGALLGRGNILREGYGDVSGDSQCLTGNIVRDWDSTIWTDGEDVFTATYTGAEATASLSAPSATAATGTRVLTATWGANTATLTLGRRDEDRDGTSGNAYYTSEVVDWINGLAGWSATLLDGDYCAFFLNIDKDDPDYNGPPGNTSAFDISVKDEVRTLKCSFDVHADGYQNRFGGLTENVIVYGEDWELNGQLVFLSAPETEKDYVFANSVFKHLGAIDAISVGSSQIGRSPSEHLVIAHCAFINQNLVIRDDDNAELDAYSLIGNNVLTSINNVSTAVVPAGVIAGNHIYGGSTIPTNSVNTSSGGDASDLFVDAAGHDYRPAGALLTNGKAPVLGFDGKGLAFKASDVMGARGSGSLSVTDYVAPAPATEWTMEDFEVATTGTGQAEILSDSVARAQRTDASNRASLVLALDAGTYRIRGTTSAWTGFGNIQFRLGTGTHNITNPLTTVSGDNAFGPLKPNIDETFTFAAPANLILFISNNNNAFTFTKGADPVVEKIS
jgi:hypothetical protein